MATWEDGPEYAPIARPAEFAEPAAAPLSMAVPAPQMAALAPKDRPAFDQPSVPVVPLATLIPPPDDQRDPHEPFNVAASTMTSDSAWGAVHWDAPSGLPASMPTSGPLPSTPFPAAPTGAPWGPPSIARRPAPDEPFPSPLGPVPPPNGFPAPGTPGWFGPGPYGEQQALPDRVNARSVLDAATPGLLICLALGGFIYVIAPVMLAVAFGLASRVKVARPEVRRGFVIGSVLWVLIAIVVALADDAGFSTWWITVSAWAVVVCWGMVLATLLMIHRNLKAGGRPVPPTRSPWG